MLARLLTLFFKYLLHKMLTINSANMQMNDKPFLHIIKQE